MALIIDTDIGSDVDDALAIAYALKSGIDVKLITTVHGPTDMRAYIAKKLTLDLGYDVPVAIGMENPIKQRHIFLTGLEGKGYIENCTIFDVERNGIDALAQTIYENRKNIDIAAIGPLTNIAQAFQRYPDLAECVNTIYIMGNAIAASDNFYLNYRAHNLKADPEAADIVFDARVNKVLVTTQVCKKNFINQHELDLLRGNPAFDYIRTAAKEWLAYIKYDVAYLYDPLVIHHAIDNEITAKVNYGNVHITTDVTPSFKDIFLETILKK
jgi:purine nucleosidase